MLFFSSQLALLDLGAVLLSHIAAAAHCCIIAYKIWIPLRGELHHQLSLNNGLSHAQRLFNKVRVIIVALMILVFIDGIVLGLLGSRDIRIF
ncbi:hypothetical protein QQS21_011422, partial [Conoideocrella luteorostrata]